MPSHQLNISMVVASALIFLVAFVANEWVFVNTEFVRGINWIYLPAGMRLLCTLLFGGPGAIGVLIASWLTCFFYFFPDDPMRSFVGGIMSAAAPYLVYRIAQHAYGLNASLSNLTATRLLMLAVVYSITSPLMHHVWLILHGDASISGFLVMIIGDLLGTLIIVYAMKGLLVLLGRRSESLRY